jgi:hypothetical protein
MKSKRSSIHRNRFQHWSFLEAIQKVERVIDDRAAWTMAEHRAEDNAWCPRLLRRVRCDSPVRAGRELDREEEEKDAVAFSHRHSRSSTMLEAIGRIKRHRTAAAAAAAAKHSSGGGGRRGRGRGVRGADGDDAEEEGEGGEGGGDGGARAVVAGGVDRKKASDGGDDGRMNAAPAAAAAGFHSGDGTLRLLVVGADRVEGTSPLETAEVFKGLLRKRRGGRGRGRRTSTSRTSPRKPGDDNGDKQGARAAAAEEEEEDAMEGVDRVDILLVGPNVMLDDGVDEGVFHTIPAPSIDDDDGDGGGGLHRRDDGRRIQLRVAYHVGLYHDMERRDDVAGEDESEASAAAVVAVSVDVSSAAPAASSSAAADDDVGSFTPDLAVAFNAGMWGYSPEEWHPTIARVLHEDGCPLVVTGYTLEVGDGRTAIITHSHKPPRDSLISALVREV